MTESMTLALLPLVMALLVLSARFYAKEGATSLLSPTFMLMGLSMAMLVVYMAMTVMAVVPAYSWVVFGGLGTLMTVGGLVSFFR